MIQVLHRAFDILELIAKEPGREYGLGEIANALQLNHGTCANIIRTMISREYIEQMGRRGDYRLGSKVYYLTGNLPYKKELLDASIGFMKELSGKLNEGIILAIIKDNKRILVHEECSNHELQVINRKEKDAYQSSTGRVILACMNEEEQESFVEKYGLPSSDIWPGVNNREDLFREFNKIRRNKLCIQIASSNIVGIAVPVNFKKSVIASLGVYLPQSRFTREMKKKIFLEIKESARHLMEKLDNHN